MTNLKARLLRVLQQADEPMDYMDLIEATRMRGIDVATGLETLERDGEVTRRMQSQGFVWTYDPSTA